MPLQYAIVNEKGGVEYEEVSTPRVPSYEYKALPSEGAQVRFLHLAPGEGRLECKIGTHTLDTPEKPPHAALSYTWDVPSHDNLTINGHRVAENDGIRSRYLVRYPLWCGGKRILISPALRDALLKFRSKTDTVVMWVDAICINQEDNEERSRQVLLMQRIYHTATTVFMWVGTEDDCAREALPFVSKLATVPRGEFSAGNLENSAFLAKHGLSDSSSKWSAYLKFFRRKYFRRIWIVQELIAAPLGAQVYCGGITPVNWTDIVRVGGHLDQSGILRKIDELYGAGDNTMSFVMVAFSIGLAWMEGFETPQQRLLLREKTLRTRRFEASDPRDKIFALIGIINDFGHRDLVGEDAPEGHGPRETSVKEGTLHATFKVDERGKSKEDIAIEILQNRPEKEFKTLHNVLIGFLRACTVVADFILHPETVLESECCASALSAALLAAKLVPEFLAEHGHVSLDHKRVGEFGQNLIKMFARSLLDYTDAISEKGGTKKFVKACRMPQIREEASRFREGTDWLANLLADGPSGSNKSSNESSSSAVKTPVLIGNRNTFDNLEYDIKYQRQFNDWAWSARGWTMPRYDQPVEQVYTEFTIKYIQDDLGLNILSHLEDASARKIPGLPSWVPDLSAPMTIHPLTIKNPKSQSGYYSASGDTKTSLQWPTQNSIRLQGFQIDEILQLSKGESEDATRDLSAQIEEWHELIAGYDGWFDRSGVCKEEALWRTVVGNRSAEGEFGGEYPAPDDYSDDFDLLRDMLRMSKVANERIENGEDRYRVFAEGCLSINVDPRDLFTKSDQVKGFERASSLVMLQRRLCVTKLKPGYFGAVPLSTQVGDLIYVLAGGETPFVLRKVPGEQGGSPDTFKVVGECYIHGIMNGEALDMEGFSWKDINLV